MVWTGDGRVFFYNPSQRASLWEKPEELIGRADVDKMIQGPPDSNKGTVTLIIVFTDLTTCEGVQYYWPDFSVCLGAGKEEEEPPAKKSK